MKDLISQITDTVKLREYHRMACKSHAYELAEAILLRIIALEKA